MSAPQSIVRDETVVLEQKSRPFRHGLCRVVLVPGAPALLPAYAGSTDPVAELRAACHEAVGWLQGPVEIVADAQGQRVARHLLEEAGPAEPPAATGETDGAGAASYLVVANGSATRGERAPGHLDERSHGFDAAVEAALRAPDPAALAAVEDGLAAELWAGPAAALRSLGDLLAGAGPAEVEYADDPFGVQYWVMRWTCAS